MLGWFGNIFLVLGLYLIGFKWRPAFLFSVVGEAVWITLAIQRHQYDLAFMCVVFGVMAIRNFIKWGSARGQVTLSVNDLKAVGGALLALSEIFEYCANAVRARAEQQEDAELAEEVV
jgi:hypothetical protein